MKGNYRKSTAPDPNWNFLRDKDCTPVRSAEEHNEARARDAVEVRFVMVLLLLIVATALSAFIMLYQRVGG